MNKNNTINIRIPAEWELQRTIFMAPGNPKADMGKSNENFEPQYKRICKEIGRFSAVAFLASKEELKEFIHDDGYTYFPNKHFDIWARDTVFIPLVSSKGVSALAPRYTFYGHHPLSSTDPEAADDERLAKAMAEKLKLPVSVSTFAFEGGSIDSDGDGTLLTTETCLLDPNRNPPMAGESPEAFKARIEAELKAATGARTVIWLYGSSSSHDITRGHVDAIARFVRPGVVVIQEPNDIAGPAREDYEKNLAALQGATDANARKLQIEIIHGPRRASQWPDEFCDSYINFLFVNGGLIVPAFGDDNRKSDAAATSKLQSLLPEYEVVPVNANAICELGGGIHCITSNFPHIRVTYDEIRAIAFDTFAYRIREKYLTDDNTSVGQALEDKVIAQFTRNGQEERPWLPEAVDNDQVLKAAVLAIASNQRKWSAVNDKRLVEAIKSGGDDKTLRICLKECIPGGFPEKDVAAMLTWRRTLEACPRFAETVLDPIVSQFLNLPGPEDRERGLSNIEKTALMAARFVDVKDGLNKKIANRMGFTLASEFFRNLGRPGFKPDIHIKALLGLWAPEYPKAMKRATLLESRYFKSKSEERKRLLAYCILADWFTTNENDKMRADQIIWLYGSVTTSDAASRIFPPVLDTKWGA